MDIEKINNDFDFLFKTCNMNKEEILCHADFSYKYYGGFDEEFEGLCGLNETEFCMMLELYVLNKKSVKIKDPEKITGIKVKHESIFKAFQNNDKTLTYAQYSKEKTIEESKNKYEKIEELEDKINLAIMTSDYKWRNELMTEVLFLSSK